MIWIAEVHFSFQYYLTSKMHIMHEYVSLWIGLLLCTLLINIMSLSHKYTTKNADHESMYVDYCITLLVILQSLKKMRHFYFLFANKIQMILVLYPNSTFDAHLASLNLWCDAAYTICCFYKNIYIYIYIANSHIFVLNLNSMHIIYTYIICIRIYVIEYRTLRTSL